MSSIQVRRAAGTKRRGMTLAGLIAAAGTAFPAACGGSDGSSLFSDEPQEGEGGAAGREAAAGGSQNGLPTNAPGGGGQGGATGKAGAAGEADACNAECDTAERCCEGVCVDLSEDVDHCGECKHRCQAQHTDLSCDSGECVVDECDAGFLDCNGRPIDGCETADRGLPGAPRLLSPELGAYTGSVHAASSRRPILRWSPPTIQGSCNDLTYHIELDDSCARDDYQTCAFESPELSKNGIESSFWVPDQALPVRTTAPVGASYGWRVRACENAERCSEWSEVRYLNVGRLRDDLNGDGYSDVFALSSDEAIASHTHILAGGAVFATTGDPPEVRPTLNLDSTLDSFADARFLGDVNGDGFMDLIRGQPGTSLSLILGAEDLALLSSIELPSPSNAFRSVAAAGDWNGDGFDDFAVSDWGSGTGTAPELVRIYLGGSPLDLELPIEIDAPETLTRGQFGSELEGGMDFDADGYSDLFILDGDDTRIHWVRGRPSTARSISASLSTLATCHFFSGSKLTRAGDMNGDGFADLAARCESRVLLYLGARTPELEPIWELALEPETIGRHRDLVGGYDLGQDGLSDLLFIAPGSVSPSLMLLPGSRSLSFSSDAVVFGGPLGDASEPRDGLSIGDHDGDGHWDVLVQVQAHQTSTERLRWLSGSEVVPSGVACDQPESSFGFVGNWCDARGEDIIGRYANDLSLDYAIVGFGHVLAR